MSETYKWSCWRHSFTGMANRTNTWKAVTERKSTVLYYPRSTTEVQLYVPVVLEYSPWLSRRRDLFPTVGATEHVTIPRHMCAYIYGVWVRWMPDSMQRCHVWRLQSATSSCMTCGFSQRTPHCVRRCQIWLLQCCPVLWLQRCQTAGINVVNSPVYDVCVAEKLYHSSEKGLSVHVINHRGCKTSNASIDMKKRTS